MADQFDDVARGLAEGVSRRRAAKMLGAGVGATFMALVAGRPVFAARPSCRGDQTPCGSKCCSKKSEFCCGEKGCCKNGQICCFDTSGNPACCKPGALANLQCINVDALLGTGCASI